MKITIIVEKGDERVPEFLKSAKDIWDICRPLRETQHTVECHANIYNKTLRYDHNSDPTENACILYESLDRAAPLPPYDPGF